MLSGCVFKGAVKKADWLLRFKPIQSVIQPAVGSFRLPLLPVRIITKKTAVMFVVPLAQVCASLQTTCSTLIFGEEGKRKKQTDNKINQTLKSEFKTQLSMYRGGSKNTKDAHGSSSHSKSSFNFDSCEYYSPKCCNINTLCFKSIPGIHLLLLSINN